MNKEAWIVVNGKTLSGGQSMAVRVAVTAFILDMEENGLGDDEHGKQMAKLYVDRLREVNELIFREMK